MTTAISGPGFCAKLVRSARRKTLSIQIRQGEVQVRAPLCMPTPEIENFVRQKTRWINKHLQRQSLFQASTPVLETGATLMWFGQPMTLTFKTAPTPAVETSSSELTIGLPLNNADMRKTVLEGWYNQQTLEYVKTRLPFYAERVQVEPRGIKVRFYKSRWGSCWRNGDLQFNGILAMAPREVIDYVIVHELCHMRVFNHSPEYWRLVADVMPDYARLRDWLRQQNSLIWY